MTTTTATMNAMAAATSSEPAPLAAEEAMTQLRDAIVNGRRLVAASLRCLCPYLDVGDIDRCQPLRDEADLDAAGIAALVELVDDAADIRLPAGAVPAAASLDDLAFLVATRQLLDRWQVDLAFDDDPPAHTIAHARLVAGLDHLDATGRSHKNPADIYDVGVGHDLAAARALAALAEELLTLANARIRDWEPGAAPVRA